MITANNISKNFGPNRVVDNCSFTIARGESYVILGQSGSGKSVLVKILAGLLIPDQGNVQLTTDNVGMLFQKNALFDSLTVFENLDFVLKERSHLNKNERKKLCQQYLGWVELSGTENLYPDELSGGMQKRLGIARALVTGPELVLYDEPTAGLDPITSRIIADLILRLKKETHSTVVTATSDVMRAFQIGDSIGILLPGKNGHRLVNLGTPAEVKKSPIPEVQQFIHGLTKGPLSPASEGHAP